MSRVLVVVAHADDEILMCGGAIAKHVKAGDTVSVLALSLGVGSRGSMDGKADRLAACIRAGDILGHRVEVLDLPDQQFDTMPILKITKEIESRIAAFSPDTVYTHWRGDLNADHRITAEAVSVACRPLPGSPTTGLLMGEVVGSTEWGEHFGPNLFIDITGDALAAKQRALLAYGDEMRPMPHARSTMNVTTLAHWRGASAGVESAEAFLLIRGIA